MRKNSYPSEELRAAAEWRWQDRISVDPAVQSGKPVIKGTRVPVEVLVGSLAGGDSMADVCEGYLVTEEDVRAALAYAAEVIGKARPMWTNEH